MLIGLCSQLCDKNPTIILCSCGYVFLHAQANVDVAMFFFMLKLMLPLNVAQCTISLSICESFLSY